MATFQTTLEKTLLNEGFYSNDPDDKGGETFMGISRNNWPGWPGWLIIDGEKKSAVFPGILKTDDELKRLVEDFYYINFWDKIKGPEIRDQEIAETLFDFAVNVYHTTAIKLAQRALNIPDDGKIGNITLQALNTVVPELFILRFTIEKINYYISLCEKNPIQKKFFYGWVRRSVSSL